MIRYPILTALLIVFFLHAETNAQKKKRKVGPPTRNPNYKRHDFTAKDGSKLTYYLMTPKNYDAKRRYPLVLTLHGRGGNTTAATVLGSAKMRETFPCFAMAPMSPRPYRWAAPRKLPKDAKQRPEKIAAVLDAIAALQKKYSIDADRIYVTGQSMGGYGSFGAVAAAPKLFAAAVPVCGGWVPGDAKKMAGVAFWVFHGSADNVVPVTGSRKMVEALKAAGAKPKYTEYEGVRHNSWTKAYATEEMWKWLFQQRRRKQTE